MLSYLVSKRKIQMKTNSSISNYLCYVVGESPERASRFHISTIRRTKAFAIAIHIPVAIWTISGFLIANAVFKLSDGISLAIALGCAAMIYLVERLVISTPKVWVINIGRVAIGIVIALLGASAVDLVIFEREIQEQLFNSKRAAIIATHDIQISEQMKLTDKKKDDWHQLQNTANCEANGTCGSKIRSTGPVYKELARQANFLKQEYIAAQNQLNEYKVAKKSALEDFSANPPSENDAGLLSRLQALHEYTDSNRWAFIAWSLFFLLVLFFELMVVFCKLVFQDTVDDELEIIREAISHQKARDYMEAVTNPAAAALALI
jgi:hypothetical protein